MSSVSAFLYNSFFPVKPKTKPDCYQSPDFQSPDKDGM